MKSVLIREIVFREIRINSCNPRLVVIVLIRGIRSFNPNTTETIRRAFTLELKRIGEKMGKKVRYNN